jgi:hypothetical protein
MAKILAVWSDGVASRPVCRGMYVLVSEMEIYMEFGIEMPVGWYLVRVTDEWILTRPLHS